MPWRGGLSQQGGEERGVAECDLPAKSEAFRNLLLPKSASVDLIRCWDNLGLDPTSRWCRRTAMYERLTVAALARSGWHDFWRTRHALFVYEVLFKLAEAWLLGPAVALVLAAILSRAGHIAVSNQDVLDFMLTPLGLLYADLFSTVTIALLLFEQAGI